MSKTLSGFKITQKQASNTVAVLATVAGTLMLIAGDISGAVISFLLWEVSRLERRIEGDDSPVFEFRCKTEAGDGK